jgi:twitching motility protein PilI
VENKKQAYDVLFDLAHRSRLHAVSLPTSTGRKPSWSGIGFSVRGYFFVTAMSEIAEVLTLPKVTKIPGVEPWVLGLSNARGRLVPVVDLSVFLYGERPVTLSLKKKKLFLVGRGAYLTAIVIDQILGMKHFHLDDFNHRISKDVSEASRSFILGSFEGETEEWPVFSLVSLFKSERFLAVAV